MKKAFTLIELLIVISIISVLAAMAIMNINGAKVKAVNARLLNDFSVASKTATMCVTEGWNVSKPASSVTGVAICSNSSVQGIWPIAEPGTEIASIGWKYAGSCNGGNDFIVVLENPDRGWGLTCTDGGCVKAGSW